MFKLTLKDEILSPNSTANAQQLEARSIVLTLHNYMYQQQKRDCYSLKMLRTEYYLHGESNFASCEADYFNFDRLVSVGYVSNFINATLSTQLWYVYKSLIFLPQNSIHAYEAAKLHSTCNLPLIDLQMRE